MCIRVNSYMNYSKFKYSQYIQLSEHPAVNVPGALSKHSA